MQPHLIFCKFLWELPQSICSVWFCHLTILEWRKWNRLTFNQSIEILILGFVPLLKTLIILYNKKTPVFGINRTHHWMMTIDCYTLVCDQVKLSWLKVREWCHGSVDPTNTQWQGLILKDFITNLPLDLKGIPKVSAWETNIRCLGIFHKLLVKWVFFSNVQARNLGVFFSFFLDIFF